MKCKKQKKQEHNAMKEATSEDRFLAKASINSDSPMKTLIDYLKVSGIRHGVYWCIATQKVLSEDNSAYNESDNFVHEISYPIECDNQTKQDAFDHDNCMIVRFDHEGNFIESFIYQ
jgi:hypothetical protein